MAGLALGLALRQGLGEQAEIIVADPSLASRPSRDPRASAIIAAGQNLFRALGVWDRIAPEAQPINDMIVTDSRLDDVMRPVFLTFAGEISAHRAAAGERSDDAPRNPAGPFAHMVENRFVVDALAEAAMAQGVTLRTCAVQRYDAGVGGADIAFNDGTTIDAPLLVAADGARSALREQAGIATHGWDYDQSGIVATIAHEREHHGRAEEHFLPSGPFAILPLKGNRSSLVWTERRKDAERIIALDEADFHAELEKRFGLHLGEIRAETKPRAFPLGYFVARSFIADRLALVGDAAHVIHPIAGQGLNLALKDVAALAEVVVEAARLGLDPGQADVLERYQRWRRFDTMAMGATTNGLNLLFSNGSNVLRTVRDVGLGLVDRMPMIKNALIRQAAGMSGDVPRLLRGETL